MLASKLPIIAQAAAATNFTLLAPDGVAHYAKEGSRYCQSNKQSDFFDFGDECFANYTMSVVSAELEVATYLDDRS